MLEIRNLCKAYGKKQVLNNLNLTIEPGQVYGLLGANGAGKTTTINLICDLLKKDQGTIKINRQKLSQQTKFWLGVAPQENLVYKTLTCRENLKFYAQIYGLKRKDINRRIKQSLAAVNLLAQSNQTVENLSGGMQRKINIAIAIVHQPKLLILDEPTTGLDIESRYEIWQLIENLRQQGMTILLTTHLLDEAERLCQKIGIMQGGKIIAEGDLTTLKRIIPAQEIVKIKTPDKAKAIFIGQELGYTMRNYGGDLAFWLPNSLELTEIIKQFQKITLDSISRQPIQLEHIYLEVTQNS